MGGVRHDNRMTCATLERRAQRRSEEFQMVEELGATIWLHESSRLSYWSGPERFEVSPQTFDLTPHGVYLHGTAPPWGDFLCDDDQSTTLQQVGSRRPIRPPRNRITTGKAVLIPQMDARAGAPARAAHGVMPNLRSVPSGRRELSKRNELCKLFARRNLFGARRNPRVG